METSAAGQSQHFVSAQEFDAVLAEIAERRKDGRSGVFGPQSMFWKINRESALFLGAGRAALLQLAHPWVSTSLQQHSRVMSNPIARFHHTFRIVFSMIFGSWEQAMGASRRLYGIHTYVQGGMEEGIGAYARGSHYEANEIGALRWVYATLVDSAVMAYEWVLPPLSEQELAAYYEESKLLAALCGISPSALPADWAAFQVYCREMERSNLLGVTDAARGMARGLLEGAGSKLKPPQWYRALTALWLPERFQGEFEVPVTPEDRRHVETVRRRARMVYCSLPGALRFVGPWHEAQGRLRGRAPGPVTRLSNRFWIGEGRLPLFAS